MPRKRSTRKKKRYPSQKAFDYWRTNTPEGAVYRMHRSAKYRAEKSGLLFTLQESDIVIPPTCPLLGVPLVPGGGRKNMGNSPSLDRIDTTKGYTPDNVWVISDRANRIKRDATLEEFEMIAANWRRRSEGRECVQGLDDARPRVDTGAKPLVRRGRTKRD